MRMTRLHQPDPPGKKIGFSIDQRGIVVGFHLIQQQPVQAGRHILGRGRPARGQRQEGRALPLGGVRKHPGQPCRHQRRGNAVAGHVERKETDPFDARGKEPDQIATHMPAGFQKQRHLGRAEGAEPFPHQRLLEPARLCQIAVDQVVKPAQFPQGRLQGAVAVTQGFLHPQDAFAGGDARAQLCRIDGLGKVIVGPHVQPARNLGLFAAPGQQDEIAITVARQGAEGTAELRPAHPRHHPVADHHVYPPGSAQGQRLLPTRSLHHRIAPTGQEGRDDAALQPAVVHDQDAAGRRG